MSCDIFNKSEANKLLKDKKIWFIGSSNMRAMYKDLLWLLTHGTLTGDSSFRTKNELSYLQDVRTTNDVLHNGRNYVEDREYRKDPFLMFSFATRLYLDKFVALIDGVTEENCPDVILINSCLWDLTRWGPDGPKNFKENVLKAMRHMKKLPKRTRVIWKTTLPVSLQADGALFIDEIKYIVPMLPWHILEANSYAAVCARFFNYDVLDLHHHMRLQGHLRVKDGVHWIPTAVRYMTNALLTHLCFCWEQDLPKRVPLSEHFVGQSRRYTSEEMLAKRIKKKESVFKKLMAKTQTVKRGFLQGIKNAFRKDIFRRQHKYRPNIKNCNHGRIGRRDFNRNYMNYNYRK